MNTSRPKPGSYIDAVIFYFIVIFFLVISYFFLGSELFWAFFGIVVSSIIITIITQSFYSYGVDYDYLFSSAETPAHVYARLTAGLFELVLYTFTITFGLFTILAGYLILKSFSVSQDKSNSRLVSASANVLRIAVVASLASSIIISSYLLNSNFIDSNFFIYFNHISNFNIYN